MAVNLYTHQGENVTKTWALMAVFLVVVVGLGYVASWYFHSQAMLYGALAFALITNLWSFWYSDKVALSLSGAQPADGAEYLELNRIVENLSITAGLPKPRVYVINDQAPNAFATGRDKNHAAVAVTTGLLRIMDRSELEGVLAHELSHVGNRDILLSTVAVVLVGFVALLSDFFLRMSFFGGDRDNEDRNPLFGILAIVAMVLAPLVATLIQLAISRKREFLADASGSLLTRYPEGLASALQKIGTYSQPMERASNATAHLFISNPFGASGVGNKISKLFSTHPPIEDRVKALVG